MDILHAIVLGVVQGLSEFLPISSSGHLELTRWLFGWDDLTTDIETAFDVAVHLGTLLGAIAYLRNDVVKYLLAGLAPLRGRSLDTDGRIAWFLVASAVPAGTNWRATMATTRSGAATMPTCCSAARETTACSATLQATAWPVARLSHWRSQSRCCFPCFHRTFRSVNTC